MEINPPSVEKFEQIACNLDEQGSGEQVRAYTCTFCKRGFSNAQALGGHMNIHRKDRAKLKQTEDESLLSVDMANKNPLIHPQPSADNLSQLGSTEGKDCTLKRPLTLSGEDDISPSGKDGMEKLHQLSLFSEKPSKSNDQRASSAGGHEEKTRHSHHGSSQKELDLELRLGPEPHETSASGSREFF